jgi:hypothetical protein
MRSTKVVFSEKFNPWMLPVAAWASAVREQRTPLSAPNFVALLEEQASAIAEQTLDSYRRNRDAWSEQLFTLIYGAG